PDLTNKNSTPVWVLFYFKKRDPAMPCDRVVVSLLSQGGHLSSASALALAYRIRTGLRRPIKDCWLRTVSAITRTAGPELFIPCSMEKCKAHLCWTGPEARNIIGPY